ncbi:mitogen-activated protein kinase kinase kinase 15 isoform X1 [Drosophila sulfurigaster albostrigata]|uniref:mitogen-activated protein kinase kinase kinase 15 isoform X1 n=1 Tax=Drosophila sulfurigaster albostrigata TaxID=89887 RepID=UPI002D21B3A7|nr:mitogen-activated protein kinase kinase kinase 15 isoform X1 [Drosophila sulfurigaster albostrigata]XP_062121954.1 mitogen-activated protein kinase kinase kinase 15 isoform X1 [Drosophila sulfurigaster albostrigata]
MDVVCVIDTVVGDHLEDRLCALEEVKQAVQSAGANFHRVQFERLDFGETNVTETFIDADVAVIDLSILTQQRPLSYHYGVRESCGMKETILIYNDVESKQTLSLKLSCANYLFLSYKLDGETNTCNLTNQSSNKEPPATLQSRLKRKLQDVEIQSKAHMREKFLSDLRASREEHGEHGIARMKEILHGMRKRLDDPHVLSVEVLHSFMFSLRDVQDYDAMVRLVNDLKNIPNTRKYVETGNMSFLYAFALNRRNRPGDREKALESSLKALEKEVNHFPDMLCLCGRIYKDMFVESDCTDTKSLENAIKWYRQSFEVQPNEYAGINLATLLVIEGKEFTNTVELQHIGMTLNNLIGKKGSLSTLSGYWDVATFFEISVLAEDYTKAIQAAECMFKLKPPVWSLKSTIGNISLIHRFRRKPEDHQLTIEEQAFQFWMDFFLAAINKEINSIRFPILILEPNKIYMPSYVTMNMDADEKSIQIVNICLAHSKNDCKKLHDFLFVASKIKSVSLYKRDNLCAYLYVHHNSDDFQIYFPSTECRQSFYDRILEMTADQQVFVNLQTDEAQIEYEYDYNEQNKKITLGKGTYGTVYAARDRQTQVRIAIKVVPEKNSQDVQPLHEEIKLHSQLRHRNIVQYLGSRSEDGFFKIFMEQVPGGSLSDLLKTKWGPLKDNESTMAFYSKQILQGLKYLHEQDIVHRDIKGDNVLVNTYSGVVKISDFGTSKRLARINPMTDTFAGTLQYMAPEVIDQGVRGYGPAADIWSFGCTNVEMATGSPPFSELGNPQAAMFKVGFYKKHPTIPEEMSPNARNFILRCFAISVQDRPSASQLLEDPFLQDKPRKPVRPVLPISTSEYGRSISVPADRLIQKTTPPLTYNTTSNTPTTPDLEVTLSTSSVDIIEMGTNHIERRNSSGFLLSPEIEPLTPSLRTSISDTSETDGFYRLKKDSQRRTTLSKVLALDESKICELWEKKINADQNSIAIHKSDLEVLIRGLRDYIMSENEKHLEATINELKQKLNNDPVALEYLHLALYSFQDAVVCALRLHCIKPHWMFALDNLVKRAVQAAITIFSPELGANLADKDLSGNDDDSVHNAHASIDSQEKQAISSSAANPLPQADQLDGVGNSIECARILRDIRDNQKQLQLQIMEQNRQSLRALHNISQELAHIYMGGRKRLSFHFRRTFNGFNKKCHRMSPSGAGNVAARPSINANPRRQLTKHNFGLHEIDEQLEQWLSQHDIDDFSKTLILNEGFTFEDFIYNMEKLDLMRLGLRVGIEVRLWKLIIQERACTSECMDGPNSPTESYHKPVNNNTITTSATKAKRSESEYVSCSE